MTDYDIVARLRNPIARAAWANAEMFTDAADEIERLRAELAAANRTLNDLHDRQMKLVTDAACAKDAFDAADRAYCNVSAERDALRDLLREAREYVADMPIVGDELLARIDAALKGGRE